MRISDWSSDVCSSDLNASPITSVPDPAEHPVVRTHPGNGRLALYVNPWFTERFSGMTAAESRPLLDFLAAEATRPENVYRHHWRQHDVIMWDNRPALHHAVRAYDDNQIPTFARNTPMGARPA